MDDDQVEVLKARAAEVILRLQARDPLTFTVLGAPVAFARTRRSAGGTLFTPSKQRHYMTHLKIMAQQEMMNRLPFDGPLELALRVEVPIAASWSKQNRQAALLGEILPSRRPDLSNYLKLIEDALNTVVYRDDAQIVQCTMVKLYSLSPKIVVTVRPLG